MTKCQKNMAPSVVVLLAAMLATPSLVFSQSEVDPWADEVVSVDYGDGAGFGQDFFPDNILGAPDPNATENVPACSPEQLLTLGGGGSIVLAFRDGGIEDGNGEDFTVFENAFGTNNSVFAEPAIVAVSEDGETWTEFSYDLEARTGLAGLTPTNGAEDPTDPTVSGGDSFDLADVDLTHVVYVRLTDIGATGMGNTVGFDLDAVVVVHGEGAVSSLREGVPVEMPGSLELAAWPNPFNAQVTIRMNQRVNGAVDVFDLLGRRVAGAELKNTSQWSWQAQSLSSGTYLVRMRTAAGTATRRVVLVR